MAGPRKPGRISALSKLRVCATAVHRICAGPWRELHEAADACTGSPHLRGALALCVIDNLMGIDAPEKIGPMLRLADVVAVTKGDLVSQAEREVYRYRIHQMNQRAVIRHVNGLTGQGCAELASIMAVAPDIASVTDMRLRFAMPAAICSYCLSEMRIGARYQKGNVKKADFGGGHGSETGE